MPTIEAAMDTIKVVCGIIENEGNYFVCRRKQGKSLAGYWEFPGGKLELGESHQEALRRELLEELDMKVIVGEYLGLSVYDYDKFRIELYGYHCLLISYDGKLVDHDLYQWVQLEELHALSMAPADIPLIDLINQ